ncbi:putative phage abortive infection protein [Peribacillus simplex]|uniref:putative phage abortive infection protein n=1 Tax=Peribacillus simplex TaxID=1478 RepID=UPI003D2C121A
MESNNDNKKIKKESFIIFVGAIIAGVAILVPFLIMDVTNYNFKLSNFDKLGVVGDFFGGTTVGLLSLSSIIFVTAAIIMQKEELELQRIEVRKTREEYEITNRTMKRQQFETTFFNMINLQHNILKEIKIVDSTGRDAIKKLYEELKNTYNTEVYENYIEKFKKEVLIGDELLLEDLVKQRFMERAFSEYMDVAKEGTLPSSYDSENEEDNENYMARLFTWEKFVKMTEEGTNEFWNYQKEVSLEVFEECVQGDLSVLKSELMKIDFRKAVDTISHVYVDNFIENFYTNPLKENKILAYESVYENKENSIGHYYRNLYRLVKLIQSETFDTNKEVNENEKRKYRGILRAQLSSFELIMIFYNVVYSKKGEKFKEILINTNFFDDHLVIDDFIWKNDFEELAKLDPAKSFGDTELKSA